MKFKETLYRETVDKENYLGFSRCNVFEAKEDIFFKDIFEDKLLSDKYNRLLNKKSLFKKVSHAFKSDSLGNQFGPLNLNLIELADFKKFDYSTLLNNIENFWQDENWGEDLALFKSNFYSVLDHLQEYDLKNRDYYYMNLEKSRKEIFNNADTWIYWIGIFSIDNQRRNVITISFGND